MNSLENHFECISRDNFLQIAEDVAISDLGHMCLVCSSWNDTLSQDLLFPLMKEIGQEIQQYTNHPHKTLEVSNTSLSVLVSKFTTLLCTRKIDVQTGKAMESYILHIDRFFSLLQRVDDSDDSTVFENEHTRYFCDLREQTGRTTVSHLIQSGLFEYLSALFERYCQQPGLAPLSCRKYFHVTACSEDTMHPILLKVIEPSLQEENKEVRMLLSLNNPDQIQNKLPPFLAASLLLQLEIWAHATISSNKTPADHWDIAQKIFHLLEVLETIECPLLMNRTENQKNTRIRQLCDAFLRQKKLDCAFNCATHLKEAPKKMVMISYCLVEAIKANLTFDLREYVDQILKISRDPTVLGDCLDRICDAYREAGRPRTAEIVKEYYHEYFVESLHG